jgi:hypothetical protein
VQVANGLDGWLELTGDLHGTSSQAPIYVEGELTGEIHVGRGLYDDPNAAVEIHVGAMASTAGIAVRWPGWDKLYDGQSWESGAKVEVGQDVYEGNTPDKNIWCVSCFKGDLNNDGVVDPFDIDAFILALSYPTEYGEAYRGLSGSMVYHGDCNCDGWYDGYGFYHSVFNAFDIDAFVLRLTNPSAWYNLYHCEHCPVVGDGPGGGVADGAGAGDGEAPSDDLGSPEAVAALLRDNVAPERLSVVIEIAAELANAYADTPRGEFWAAVLAELE